MIKIFLRPEAEIVRLGEIGQRLGKALGALLQVLVQFQAVLPQLFLDVAKVAFQLRDVTFERSNFVLRRVARALRREHAALAERPGNACIDRARQIVLSYLRHPLRYRYLSTRLPPVNHLLPYAYALRVKGINLKIRTIAGLQMIDMSLSSTRPVVR